MGAHARAWLAGLAAACAAAALAVPAPAGAQEPLLTVGVDVTEASLTHATYALFVANRGNATAPEVVLTNDVPNFTTFSSSDRAPRPPDSGALPCEPGAPAGRRCRWSLGDLEPGSSATVAVTYALNDASYTMLPNTAFAQVGGAPPDAGKDPADTDRSLARAVHILDQDTHADDTQPDKNFGECDSMNVRRDNKVTGYVDNDSVAGSLIAGVERVWEAELKVTVDSVSPPPASAPIAAHRVIGPEWAQGQGDCTGAVAPDEIPSQSEHRDVRGDNRPSFEAAPTATALVTRPGPMRWDVTGAFASPDERSSFSGFELRTGDSPGSPTDAVAFRSSEAADAATRPRLVVVHTRSERPSCVDADPELATGPSDRSHRIDAYVTDGFQRVERSSVDGCMGSPVPAAPVGWEIDHDSPDLYISSLAGAPTSRGVEGPGDAGPNEGSTRAGPDGRTFVEIRRGEPFGALGDATTNRIAAIVLQEDMNGALDPSPGGASSGVAEPEDTCQGGAGQPPHPCESTGESLDEDDVRHTWGPAEGSPPARGDGSPAAGAASPGGGAGSGGGSGAANAADGPARSISLAVSRSRATVGQAVSLTGRLASPAGACASAREVVQILRRRRGTRELTDFASVSTAPDGSFELPVLVDQSAEYVAVSPAREGCAAASSSAVDVAARGRVRTWVAGPTTVPQGRRVRIRGRVVPALRGSVVLERRAGRRWKAAARRRLSRRSAFSFPLRARWSGRRTFRVRWQSPDPAYLGGVSRPVALRTRPAG